MRKLLRINISKSRDDGTTTANGGKIFFSWNNSGMIAKSSKDKALLESLWRFYKAHKVQEMNMIIISILHMEEVKQNGRISCSLFYWSGEAGILGQEVGLQKKSS